MLGRRRQAPPSVVPDHVRQRVSRIDTPDLMQWAEQAVYLTGRYLARYGRDRSQDSLDEAVNAARALLAVMDEMTERGALPR